MLFHSELISNPRSDSSTSIRFVWQTTRNPEAVAVIETVHDETLSVKLMPTDKARQMYLGLLNAGRLTSGTGWMVHDSCKLVMKDDMHMALRMLRLNAPGS